MPVLKRSYEERVFFEDEMRAGTRTESKRRWTPCGHRPVCKVKLGYEFCYLYAAIAPECGHLLALLLPEMTKECFELFMDFFRKETVKLYGELPVLLLTDQAGSHQREVMVQRGIAWEPIPTACPELNPVERFFEEVRKDLSNMVFENIKQVEDCLSASLKKFWDNPKAIIQLCNFPYIRST
jgi:transposase